MYSNIRGFDAVRYNDGEEKIAVTGSVNYNAVGHRAMSITTFNASDGTLIVAKHYNLIGNYTNSQGMNIIHTEGLLDTLGRGFVVTGFMNNAYMVDSSSNNVGIVLRVDESLNKQWVQHVDKDFLPNFDYDFANKAIETSNGFFITGSRSKSLSIIPYEFSEIMAIKIDWYGTKLWESSYLHNFTNGIGVDAYFDESEDKIYLLANYTTERTFGVTVFDNSIGNIIASSSWYGELLFSSTNWYGFKISESFDDNTLVIHGYARNFMLENEDDVMVPVQSTPFAYEFDKTTGNEVKLIQYEVLYETPISMDDFFYFWNSNMPSVYYPDIAFRGKTSDKYFSVAYRTHVDIFTKMEVIQADMNLLNACNNQDYDMSPQAISPTIFDYFIYEMDLYEYNFQFGPIEPDYEVNTCNIAGGGGYIIDPTGISNLKEFNVTIFPNPAKDFIKFKSEKEISKVIIYDLLGSKLLETDHVKNGISISQLNKGTYIIKIAFDNNETINNVFLKE